MRVERIPVERVKEKLQKLKKDSSVKPVTFETIEKKIDEEITKREADRHQMEVGRKKLKLENDNLESKLSELDPQIANFDLPLSFNTSKRKH